MDYEIVTNSADETIAFGVKVGKALRGGEVIGIIGNLGSGKTHLIKGIVHGAGAGDARRINSPTFVIVNEYSGRIDIYHIDAYRLASSAEFEQLGFDDFCNHGSVVLIEWADRVEAALKGVDWVRIELSHQGQQQRKIVIREKPSYFTV